MLNFYLFNEQNLSAVTTQILKLATSTVPDRSQKLKGQDYTSQSSQDGVYAIGMGKRQKVVMRRQEVKLSGN